MPDKITQIPNISEIKTLFAGASDKLTLISKIELLILKEQLGNCCKPIAIYHVHLLDTLRRKFNQTESSNAKLMHRFAAPFYSHDRNSTFKRPILSQAEKLGSAVGELYSAKQITDLLEANGTPCIAMSTQTIAEYIHLLKEQVESDYPAIIFFDVDKEGGPGKFNSKREHAAVVVGYGVKEGRDYFVLAHWNQYHIVDAIALAESALQLQEHREPETFYKIYENRKAIWLTVDDLVSRKKFYKESLKQYEETIVRHEAILKWVKEQLIIATENLEFADYLDVAIKNSCQFILEQYPLFIDNLHTYIENLRAAQERLANSLKEIPTNLTDLPMKKAEVTNGGLRGIIIHTIPRLEFNNNENIVIDSENELTRPSLTRRQTIS